MSRKHLCFIMTLLLCGCLVTSLALHSFNIGLVRCHWLDGILFLAGTPNNELIFCSEPHPSIFTANRQPQGACPTGLLARPLSNKQPASNNQRRSRACCSRAPTPHLMFAER